MDNGKIISDAISRLTDELKTVKGGDRYVNAVKNAVSEALMDCCNKSADFARQILASDKDLDACLKEICKGLRSSISDAELFTRAVQFYFPAASVHWNLEIVCGEKPENAAADDKGAEEKAPAPSPERKIISIFDML